MAQYHIFHSVGPRMFSETVKQPREYVGFVEASSLEDAFAKSQNGDNPWNPYQPCRSTSVGDVIQDNSGFYMVLGLGFRHFDEGPSPIVKSHIVFDENDTNWEQLMTM